MRLYLVSLDMARGRIWTGNYDYHCVDALWKGWIFTLYYTSGLSSLCSKHRERCHGTFHIAAYKFIEGVCFSFTFGSSSSSFCPTQCLRYWAFAEEKIP